MRCPRTCIVDLLAWMQQALQFVPAEVLPQDRQPFAAQSQNRPEQPAGVIPPPLDLGHLIQ